MTKISWQDRKREQKRKQKRVERQYQQDNQLPPPGEYITTNIEGINTYIVEITKGESDTIFHKKRMTDPKLIAEIKDEKGTSRVYMREVIPGTLDDLINWPEDRRE